MGRPKPTEEKILEKLRRLPPDRVAEVEDFVDFLSQRDEGQALAEAATGSDSARAASTRWPAWSCRR